MTIPRSSTRGPRTPELPERAVLAQPPDQPSATVTRRGSPAGPLRRTPPAGSPGSDAVLRVGAKYAVRNPPTTAAGLAIAAWAIRHNLVGPATSAANVNAADYLALIDGLPRERIDAILSRALVQREELVRRIPAQPRGLLADELRRAAATPSA